MCFSRIRLYYLIAVCERRVTVNDGDSGRGHTAVVSCLLASGDVAREPISGCSCILQNEVERTWYVTAAFIFVLELEGGRSVFSCCICHRPHSPH